MYSEDDFLWLSALQHLAFCERQCALIHIEGLWDENRLTVEGKILHDRVDSQGHEYGKDIRIERGVSLRSLELGLIGKADVVEFHRESGKWVPFPVEYKRGRPKPDRRDEIQLCAQALCLEEMLRVEVNKGAIFYGQPRRRWPVEFGGSLRQETRVTAQKLHALISAGITPPAVYEKKCDNCSLFEQCLPKVSNRTKSAAKYLSEAMNI